MATSLVGRFSYLQQIWDLRYFWSALVRLDLDNRYRNSFFGIGWSLLRPMAMTAVFCVVFGKLFNLSLAEYAPHLIVGMTVWQFFTESLVVGCNTFTAGAAYIRQQQIPLAIFPLRTALGTGFHSLIALGMAISVTGFFKGIDPVAMLSLIPAIMILFLLSWCLAIVSGFAFTHFPDTSHLLEIGLQVLFYATPILYSATSFAGSRGHVTFVLEWNPLTSIIALVRVPIVDGTLPSMQQYGMSLAFLGVVATIALVLLRKLERNLVFWV